jgi:peptide/nickel transport system permease protein
MTADVVNSSVVRTGGLHEDDVERSQPSSSTWSRVRSLQIGVWLAGAWVVLVIVLALTANWLPIKGYDDIVGPPSLSPGFRFTNPLGTDTIGRSELSRLIFGARSSLLVAFLSVVIGMCIGTGLGMLAGYVKGWFDGLTSIVTDSILSIPALVLLIALGSIRAQSLELLIGGLVVISIPTFTRLARAQTLSHAQRAYVVAARALGMKRRTLLISEVLPNVALPILSFALVIVALLIIVEGSLSFLGLGIPPPSPSWGGMIADGTQHMTTSPALVLTPSIVVLITVLSFNVLGDHARRKFG